MLPGFGSLQAKTARGNSNGPSHCRICSLDPPLEPWETMTRSLLPVLPPMCPLMMLCRRHAPPLPSLLRRRKSILRIVARRTATSFQVVDLIFGQLPPVDDRVVHAEGFGPSDRVAFKSSKLAAVLRKPFCQERETQGTSPALRAPQARANRMRSAGRLVASDGSRSEAGPSAGRALSSRALRVRATHEAKSNCNNSNLRELGAQF